MRSPELLVLELLLYNLIHESLPVNEDGKLERRA